MLLRKNIDNRLLLIVGSTFTTLCIVLGSILHRSGKSTDISDFSLGIALGVGIGCLILFAWRVRHERRPNS